MKRSCGTVLGAALLVLFAAGCGRQEAVRTEAEETEEKEEMVEMAETRDFKVATGYSDNEDPLAGAKEAVAMAIGKLGDAEPQAVIFYENYNGHAAEKEIGRVVAESAAGAQTIGVRAPSRPLNSGQNSEGKPE